MKLSTVLGAIYSYVWQNQIFLKKFPSGKNDQKWSKMTQKQIFWTFWENHVISFVWNLESVKWTFFWFINILWKMHAWEKSGSEVIAKNGARPMRFQYSLIVNISLIEQYLILIFGM